MISRNCWLSKLKFAIALLPFALGVCVPGISRGAIQQYSFTGNSAAPNFVEVGVDSSGATFSDGDGTLNFATLGAPSPSVFKSFASMPSGTTSTNNYFQFSIAALPNYRLSLTSLVFDAQRDGGTNAASNVTFRLFYSTNAFATAGTALVIGPSATLSGSSSSFVLDLTSILTNVVPPTVTFRLYANDNDPGNTLTNASQGVRVDNVEINGNIQTIPEPASLAIWGIGLGLAAFMGKRFRRAAL